MNPLIRIFMCIVLATVFFIIANILGGATEAIAENKFDWTVLKDSLMKYLVILFIAALLYAGGYFGDEVLKDYTTEYINVKNLVATGLTVYAANRALDASKKWITLIELKAGEDNEQ